MYKASVYTLVNGNI